MSQLFNLISYEVLYQRHCERRRAYNFSVLTREQYGHFVEGILTERKNKIALGQDRPETLYS